MVPRERTNGETRAIISPGSANPVGLEMQVGEVVPIAGCGRCTRNHRNVSNEKRDGDPLVGLGWIIQGGEMIIGSIVGIFFTHPEGYRRRGQQVRKDNSDMFYNSRLSYTTPKSIPIMQSSSRRPRPSWPNRASLTERRPRPGDRSSTLAPLLWGLLSR